MVYIQLLSIEWRISMLRDTWKEEASSAFTDRDLAETVTVCTLGLWLNHLIFSNREKALWSSKASISSLTIKIAHLRSLPIVCTANTISHASRLQLWTHQGPLSPCSDLVNQEVL